MANEYEELLLENAERIVALLKANATHQSHLHELPAAAADKGLMSFCPGCELIVRTGRIKDMAEARDDKRAQKRYGNRSRRESVLAASVSRRAIEEPNAPPLGRGT